MVAAAGKGVDGFVQQHTRRPAVATFTIVTQHAPGVSFGVSGEGYKLEMEALAALDAEIVEVKAATEEEFIAAARHADAIIAKGRAISKRIIDALEQCKVIALGSVGADSVDVAAATARHIPRYQRAGHLHRGSRRPCPDAHSRYLPASDHDGPLCQRRPLARRAAVVVTVSAPHGPDAGVDFLRARGQSGDSTRQGLWAASAGL